MDLLWIVWIILLAAAARGLIALCDRTRTRS